MKAALKQMALDNLRNRPIVIFGAGIMAHAFYEMYKDKLNFAFCVTNNSAEWGEKRFCNELDVRRYQAQELKGKYYVVLSVNLAFDRIASQLECDGYVMFHDFIDHKVAESILEHKKLAFFYGTCNLRDAFHAMERVPAFMEQYVSIFVQTKRTETISENRRLYYGKELCDVYVYARRLIDLDKAYNMQADDLPADCKVIGVSNITFDGYWPQLNHDRHLLEYNADWVFEVSAPFGRNFWHLMYSREDANITKLVKEGKTPEEVYQILSADDFYSDKVLKKHFRICFKTLQMSEKGLDVKVGEFIQKQYKNERLYQDFIHGGKAVTWEYARQILENMDVYDENLEHIIEDAPEYIHRSSDMPIYPSVAKYMGLSWIDEKTQYEVLTYKGVRLMTFKEYVMHYAAYTQAALKIRESW